MATIMLYSTFHHERADSLSSDCEVMVLTMGPASVRIHHRSHDFGWQSSHSVDLAGWQAKMASIEI